MSYSQGHGSSALHSTDIELATEASVNQSTNSTYQLLDSRRKWNWPKKYVIIGTLLVAVLMAGTISFLVVYSQNQNLTQELDRVEELSQLEEQPYISPKNGRVVVDDLPSNDQSHQESASTTNHPESGNKNGTVPVVIPGDNSGASNTTTSTDNKGDSNSTNSQPEPKPVIRGNALSYLHEKGQKGQTTTYNVEECVEGRAQRGFKCTATIPLSSKSFYGFGKSKQKAKKAASEFLASDVFNVTFETTTKDLKEAKEVEILCGKSKLVSSPSPS